MAKKEKLSLEELLEQALVKEEDQPYEVPENWVWVKLKSICDKITDGEHIKPSLSENGIPLLTAKNVLENEIDFTKVDYVSDAIANKSWERCQPEVNNILICSRGTIGRNTIVSTNQKFCLMGTVILLKLSFKYIIPQYVNFVLKLDILQNYMKTLCGSTAVSALYLKDIKKLPIPLPPFAEQQRIVALIESLFEKLDRAKELAQNALDSFENRKSAILHKAFTGELTSKWREANGGDFEKDWVEKKLGELCSINPKKIDTKNLNDDLEVTFVPMAAVSDVLGIIELPQMKMLAEVKKGYTNFSNEDVIFAKITPCMENGKSAIIKNLVNNIGFGSTEFHVLRCSERLLNRYLYYLVRWQMFRDEAKQVMSGAVGQQRVPKIFLEEYLLNVPPLSEQQEIVRILDNLLENEQKAKALCDVIEKIDHMKKSILARAFRGELSTNNPAEESALELLKEVLKEKM